MRKPILTFSSIMLSNATNKQVINLTKRSSATKRRPIDLTTGLKDQPSDLTKKRNKLFNKKRKEEKKKQRRKEKQQIKRKQKEERKRKEKESLNILSKLQKQLAFMEEIVGRNEKNDQHTINYWKWKNNIKHLN